MRRQRHALDALDDKPGMGDSFWRERKDIAETRMSAIDESPLAWRDLVNEFGLEPVVALAKLGVTDADWARRTLERRRGDG